MNKKLTVNVVEGTVTERLTNALDAAKKTGDMGAFLNSWVIAGFLLHELGAGVIDSLVSMEKRGEMDGFSNSRKASILTDLLKNCERFSSPETTTPGNRGVKPPAKLQTFDDVSKSQKKLNTV